MEKFQAAKYRVFRATVYVLLGCWGIVPICHQLWSHANVWAIQQAFKLDLLMGFFYLVRGNANWRTWLAHPRPPLLLLLLLAVPDESALRPPFPGRPCICGAQLGAFLFASRIPECWMPGKFDLLGASHQLFHACVVVAAYIHYR